MKTDPRRMGERTGLRLEGVSKRFVREGQAAFASGKRIDPRVR